MTPDFILASNSPRRRELLTMLGMDFRVLVSDCDETVEDGMTPDEVVRTLSKKKAEAVAHTLSKVSNTYIIAADTVVAIDGKILGKPKDKADAYETLMTLSGREHSVLTGVTVMRIDGSDIKTVSEHTETRVRFGKMSESEIRFYVESGEPLDKAGSYGVQGLGGFFVDELHGDYYNVVGLPIAGLRAMLRDRFGLESAEYIGKK